MEALALLTASKSGHSCGSVADLQAQLRDLFGRNVTEKRVDHISTKFELRPTTVFHVSVTETENETLENAANVDPVLGGSRSSVAPTTPGVPNHPARQISALDAIVNQPVDDHVLQKSVAKHIIFSLSEVDQSNWIVRQVSRGEQGWTFTYICKDSFQAWSRQNSKTPAKIGIGEWSNKDGQDPVNMSRPAFDCRGSVTIAFVKSTRTIDVKYDHTPMHKTVAQLVELLAPPIITPVPVKPPPSAKKASMPPKEPKEPRPPRAPKAPKDPNAPKPPRRKRRAEDGGPEGENSTPKRRRKKKDSAANTDINGNVIPPEMPGALPVGQDSEHSLYSNGDGSQQNGYSAYPEGLVGSSAANDNNSRSVSQGASSANGGVHSQSILNLPPGEAARRRDVAIKLLSERDIDPQTLSPEQFNIFANQSPDLQRESLAMLVKYGAERLRIVHPTKDGASSGQSTPQGNSGSPAGLAYSANAVSASPSSPSKSKKSRKKKADAAAEETQADPVSDSGRARPTRGACQSCRNSKTKCDKSKPSCTQCLASGTTCHYRLAKPRVSRVSKATLEQEEAEEAEGGEHTVVDVDDEPEDLGSPGFHHDPAPEPHGHGLSATDPTPSTYSQPSGLYDNHSSFSFPESVSHDVHSGIAPSSMEYMPSPAADNPLHNYSYPAPVQQTPVPIPEPPAAAIQPEPQQHVVSTRSKSRRSLPSGPVTQASASTSANALADHGSSWQTMNQAAIAPPTRTSPRSSRTRKSTQNHNQSSGQTSGSQAYDDLRQNSSWPQSTTPIPLPPQAQLPQSTSPYQAAAQTTRAKSRQSNRAQTRTPVQSMSTVRPSQTHASKSLTDSSGYPSAAGGTDSNSTGYDSYSQYQNTRADSTSNRVTSYDQYSTNPSSTSLSNSYTYDTYSPRSTNTTPSTALANPVPQTTTTSYNSQTASTTPSTSHWGSGTTASDVSQTRNSQAYNSNTQAASNGRSSSYNLAAPSTTQQTSQALQGFSVRPPPPSAPTTRSASANAYNQQAQQQGSQRQNYNNSYSSQPHGANSSTTAQQQQNWYSFTPANNSSSNYTGSGAQQHGSSGASTAYPANTGGSGSSHTHPHAHGGGASNYAQSQHHRSMNLSSHTYSSIDGGEHALYEMLSNNQSG